MALREEREDLGKRIVLVENESINYSPNSEFAALSYLCKVQLSAMKAYYNAITMAIDAIEMRRQLRQLDYEKKDKEV